MEREREAIARLALKPREVPVSLTSEELGVTLAKWSLALTQAVGFSDTSAVMEKLANRLDDASREPGSPAVNAALDHISRLLMAGEPH